MKIELKNLYPRSFKPATSTTSDVWNRELILSAPDSCLLIAPSGSGKSSLTGFLYGYRSDYSGEILFNNTSITSYNLNQWVEIRRTLLSVVFQDLRLFEQLSVEENLKLKSTLHPTLSNQTLKDYATRLGIAPFLSRKVNTLSMGQKQRVAILRALLQPFKFLLLDEPFSHLDPENTSVALQLIQEVCSTQQAGFILNSLHEDYSFSYAHTLKL